MLKIIGTIAFLTLSSMVYSHEYEVLVSDKITGEVQVENFASSSELSDVKGYLKSLEDSTVHFEVRKFNGETVTRVRMGGGEGSGD